VAAELTDGRVRETAIALTPAGDGRFEIYVNGTKIYDRKEAGESGDFLASLRKIREVKQTLVKELDAVAV
jgi:predicted Rdx family selenoprotein